MEKTAGGRNVGKCCPDVAGQAVGRRLLSAAEHGAQSADMLTQVRSDQLFDGLIADWTHNTIARSTRLATTVVDGL